ncbi:Uncharacterized protein FWK35_00026276 [Aphis craccivora]|uniref:Uncharacterized protein n=1 Tax=Aphis craccivora TaxID=307492 RepID=A0A6G0WBG8_APHCR|nr:Uncharacterized protein FWK35_00026276 [Aphis craccivora]
MFISNFYEICRKRNNLQVIYKRCRKPAIEYNVIFGVLEKNKSKYEQFEPSTLIYKDKKNKRSYDVLKKITWSDIINNEFIAKYNLPCNFVYKSCKVRKTMIYSKYFLTFKAKCKDDGCELFGWSEKKPDICQPLEIIGQQLLIDLASNWRRDNVKDMEFGDMSHPNLYKSSVLRKVKQQHKDNILGITQKNQIESVVELKRNTRFSGSIHEVGTDPLLNSEKCFEPYIECKFEKLESNEDDYNGNEDDQEDVSSCDSNVSLELAEITENWHSFGKNQDIKPSEKEKRKRITKYMECTVEIEKMLNKKNTRSHLNTLLLNENTTSCLRVSRKRYMVHNNCHFDSVAAMISIAYLDHC